MLRLLTKPGWLGTSFLRGIQEGTVAKPYSAIQYSKSRERIRIQDALHYKSFPSGYIKMVYRFWWFALQVLRHKPSPALQRPQIGGLLL